MKRSFQSGAQKRQKKKKDKLLIDQIPKVSSFFRATPSQSRISEGGRPTSSSSSIQLQPHPYPDNHDEAIVGLSLIHICSHQLVF